MNRGSFRWLLLVVLLGITSGCNDAVAPGTVEQVRDGELEFLPISSDAPPLTHTDVSVWAVRGQARDVEMTYSTYGGTAKCLHFLIPPQALLKYPDGTTVAHGDSVLIKIRVLNSSHFVFEFEPGGVRFDPNFPARLEIRYAWADTNGDGKATDADAENVALYRQERPGMIWEKVPATVYGGSKEIRASITGFTRYALATD